MGMESNAAFATPGGRIGQARAKVADNNACLMCNTSVAVSCGSCDLLMTNADVAQLGGTAESIQHSDYGVAAKDRTRTQRRDALNS